MVSPWCLFDLCLHLNQQDMLAGLRRCGCLSLLPLASSDPSGLPPASSEDVLANRSVGRARGRRQGEEKATFFYPLLATTLENSQVPFTCPLLATTRRSPPSSYPPTPPPGLASRGPILPSPLAQGSARVKGAGTEGPSKSSRPVQQADTMHTPHTPWGRRLTSNRHTAGGR
jgi:hypothetical protein